MTTTADTSTRDRCATRIGFLTVKTPVGSKSVTAEQTGCRHLRITPVVGAVGELTGQWRLSHAWTGLGVPGTDGLDPRELRDLAVLVGGHPGWSSTWREELAGWADELRALVDEAVARCQR